MLDTKALAEATASIVRDHLARAIEPLLAENKALSERLEGLSRDFHAADAARKQLEAGLAELVNRAPVVLTDEQIADIVRSAVEAAVPLIEIPEPIAPDMAVIEEFVAEHVSKAVAAIEPAAPIEPDTDAISATIAKLVTAAVADLPRAEKGETGVGIAGALIDRDGALVVTLSDGKAVHLGRVVGKDGDPGVPFGPDDLSMDLMDDGRTLQMSFSKGATAYAFNVHLPVPIYRGVWRDDVEYEDGDMVTWGGSAWHSNAEKATGKPGDPNSAWVLAVKAGRAGKDKI